MVLQLRCGDLLVVLILVIVVVFLVFRPLDAPDHELFVSLDGPGPALGDHDVRHAWARDAAAREVKLLSVHVYLEQVPLVREILDLEHQHLRSRLRLGHPLLLLLGLALLGRQLAGLVALLVLSAPLLYLLPYLPLDGGGVRDGLVAEDSHQIAHLHLGGRRLQNAHLDLVSDLLCALLPLQAPQLFALLGRQVHHHRLWRLLLGGDLDRYRVLHVWRDLLDVHLRVRPLLAVHVLLQERHIPPLHVWDRLAPHDLWLDLLYDRLRLSLLFLLLLFFLFLLLLVLLLVHA
mmetsp:Transcript_29825/g.85172  ORF Transcript_29825/g.85172 Transcript_29825/m.85172 type:complete len:290 (+) Transcript_29825:332-1201(+)